MEPINTYSKPCSIISKLSDAPFKITIHFKLLSTSNIIRRTFNNAETYNGVRVFRISGIRDGKYHEYVMFSRNEQLFQLLFIMKKDLVERFKKDKFKILKGIKNYK